MCIINNNTFARITRPRFPFIVIVGLSERKCNLTANYLGCANLLHETLTQTPSTTITVKINLP